LTEGQKNDSARRQYEQWLSDTQGMAVIEDNWTTDIEGQADAISPLLGRAVQPRQPIATISVPTSAPPDAAASPPAAP
jgi:hypothetical protein